MGANAYHAKTLFFAKEPHQKPAQWNGCDCLSIPRQDELWLAKCKLANSSILLLDFVRLHEHKTLVQMTRCGRPAPNNPFITHRTNLLVRLLRTAA